MAKCPGQVQLPFKSETSSTIMNSPKSKSKMYAEILKHFDQNIKNIATETAQAVGRSTIAMDSVHSLIEKCTRNKVIETKGEWITAIRMARTNPEPYEVTSVEFDFFLNWEQIKNEVFPLKIKKH